MAPHQLPLMSSRLAVRLVAGVVSLCALAAPQAASADAKLEKALFFGSPDNAPTVHVGAEGGQWLLMKSSGITYRFSYYVKANRMLRTIFVGSNAVPPQSGAAPWFRGGIRYQHTAWGKGSFFLSNAELGEDRA